LLLSTKQNIVVLHAGTKVSSFLGMLIESRKIRFKIIVNTLLDIPVPGEKDNVVGWIGKELISTATSIIKDDLTSSPLASLFSQSMSIEVIKLPPSEQFLASWFSEIRNDQKTAFEKTISVFDTLTNYSSLPVKVYPLSYQQKKPITIKYRNQMGSPRTYQIYGYLDLKKKTAIDPVDIKSALTEGKDIDIDSLDEKETLVPAEIEKILKEADAVIITADDYFSLTVMLSYLDVRKSIKKSQGSVLTIAPIGSRFTLDEREKVLLEMFHREPNINGFLDLMKDVSDTLCLDTGDSAVVGTARESGFNIIVEDLLKIEDKNEHLALILKAAGVDVTNFNVEIKANEPEKAKKQAMIEEIEIKKQPVQVKVGKSEESTEAKKEVLQTEVISENNEKPTEVQPEIKNELKTDIKENSDPIETNSISNKLELSANVAKSVSKNTSDVEMTSEEDLSSSKLVEKSVVEISGEKISSESTLDKIENETEDEIESNSREVFNRLINKLIEEDFESLESWIREVEKYIKKDDGNTIQVANGILSVIKQTTKDKVRNNAINAMLILSENRKLAFRNVLLVWLVTHLQDPDFSIQNSQYEVIRKMILNEKNQDFVGNLLEEFIKQLLTSKDMNPSKQERGRLLVQRIAYNSRKLSKYAIKAFLDLFDYENVSHNDIWPGLSSFDARLVGIELVEGFSVLKSRTISEEAKRKELGSFSHLLEDIVSSWEKGDMNRLTFLCGSISESALRKAKRLSLVQNIKKVGTIPLEILAKSLKEDPKELESLVYEMVMNDEIHAKLEIVEGRLYILPIEIDEDKIRKEKIDPIELKESMNETSSENSEGLDQISDENDTSSNEIEETDLKKEKKIKSKKTSTSKKE
jgi:hypothetical protein